MFTPDLDSSFSIAHRLILKFAHKKVDLGERFNFYIFLKFVTDSYMGFRHFFKLPVRGHRTWSNRKSQRRTPSRLWLVLDRFFFKKHRNYCNRSRRRPVLYAEAVNRFYYFFFTNDWNYARLRRERYDRGKKWSRWVYDLKSVLANRVYTYLENDKEERPLSKKKKRRNKKKKKIPNNYFNIGFRFLFTKEMQHRVFKHFFVVKRSPMPKKKKKKK